MEKATKQEVWLRGPVPQVPPLLQPVAHILMQAQEEVNALMLNFQNALLWSEVAGVASPGFHLQHITGVLDRLFTYASGSMLTDMQLQYLYQEGKLKNKTTEEVVAAFNNQVNILLEALPEIDINTLTDYRAVGRAQLPSTVIGLLTHAAEHTMRHIGQLLVTVRILEAK